MVIKVMWLCLSKYLIVLYSHFHKEAFYSFSLAYLNCQHLYFWALKELSEKGLLEHKHCDTMAVDLIAEKATK